MKQQSVVVLFSFSIYISKVLHVSEKLPLVLTVCRDALQGPDPVAVCSACCGVSSVCIFTI